MSSVVGSTTVTWHFDFSADLERLHHPMALTQEKKQELINNHQIHETDTGSADLQVAMLSERIQQLSTHLQSNQKDYASRQGLLKMIGQRKRLLGYIRKQDVTRYRALIAKLGIRG